MKANELRIGNFVGITKNAIHANGSNYLKQVFEIQEIRNTSVHFKGFAYGEFFENIIPIPLTEDWLIKFGFKNDDDDWLIDIDHRTCIHVNLKKKRTLLESYDGLLTIKNIEYIHSLQNLYFALTEEELTLKENS